MPMPSWELFGTLDRKPRLAHSASTFPRARRTMPIPDHVATRIKRSLDDMLSAEIGSGSGTLYDAMRPLLQRAFERGISLGVTLTAAASGQGVESLKAGLTEHFGLPATPAASVARPTRRLRAQRSSGSGKTRAAPGAVGQAIELVLADQPGLRIVEMQDVVAGLDPTISRSSIVN